MIIGKDMMVMDRMAWFDKSAVSDTELRRLRVLLTKTPKRIAEFAMFDDDDDDKEVALFEEHGRWFGVPRAYWESELRPKMKLREFSRFSDVVAVPNDRLRLSGLSSDGPYAEQAEMVETIVSYLRDGKGVGGIFRADPGYGKTVVALRAIAGLKVPTIVVVHKEFLMNQWYRRIQKYLPDAKVGFIQQERAEFVGCDIVIAMLQSLAQREYCPELFNSFGLVISDECHRLGSCTWAPVIRKFRSKWRLGLSATLRRKDGMEDVFRWNIGPVIAQAKVGSKIPSLKRIRTSAKLPSMAKFEGNSRVAMTDKEQGKSVMTPTVLRYLCKDTARNAVILEQVYLAATSLNRRKVIVLSERKESHLHILRGVFEDMCRRGGKDITTSFYYGGKSERDLALAERAQVIFSTFQMVSEALDIEALDMVVLATPVSDVEQAIGRVRRHCLPSEEKCVLLCPWRAGMCKGKPEPIVLDVMDPLVEKCNSKARWRLALYREIGMLGKCP